MTGCLVAPLMAAPSVLQQHVVGTHNVLVRAHQGPPDLIACSMQAEFQPHSWLSALAAPRETVVQQLWRQDEHGVYLVMVHSTDHPNVPEVQHPWWHWFAPVRAQVSFVTARGSTP